MKPKLLAFPLLTLALSPSAMGVGQFIWTGAANSTWTDPANWDTTSAPSISGNNHPIPGTHYKSNYLTLPAESDFLNIRNNGDLTIVPTGITPGADAVYDPGAGTTTTFSGGRVFVIGTGNGPAANPPNTKGYAKLSVLSGTIVGLRGGNVGSEPYMANRADSTLIINGGAVDLSGHVNAFRLIQEGLSGITSTITITNGSLSCRSLDLIFDQESTSPNPPEPQNVFGTGIVNLNGGSFSTARFIRSAASNSGQTSFTFNLNGGTFRPLVTLTSPAILLDALTDLKTVVKSGGAIINTTSPLAPTMAINSTIAEVLEHDTALGASPDGGLTKNGIGTLTLTGTNTFTGPVTINAGTSTTASRLLLANNSAAGSGTITLADSYAEIQVNNTRNIPNAIIISDTGDLKTLLLPAPTPAGFAGATFSGPITINETNIDNFRLRADSDGFLTLSGKISGVGGIYKYQPGTVTLSNTANDFTGGAKITTGGLSFANGGLGTTGSITMDGGTLSWSAGNSQDISSRLVMVTGKTATLNTPEATMFASAIGNGTTAAFTKIGVGTLDLTLASTYSGGTTITQGTLGFPLDGLGTAGTVTMNGGILRWAAGNTQDLSSRIAMVNAKTATFSTNGNDVTFANSIGSSTTAGLTKSNTLGTLTLSGANTYSGTTTVGGGILKIGNSTSLGVFGPQTTTTPPTTVSSGATLDLNGVTGVNELITISGTGVGTNGALVNNSGTPAGIDNGIVGLTVAATGSGSGYSSAPSVVISGTGTGALATASLGVTTESFDVSVSGDRVYSVAPNVTIAGGGTGATATAVLDGGATGTVIGIVVTSAGSGFTTTPTAVISGGTSTGTTTTTFAGNASNFTVGGLTLTNAGSGYTTAPALTFDGSPATVTTTFSSVVLAANSSVGGTGNTTINGVVSQSGGSRSLTKVGAGTVTLNGANTYTGETIVNEGTLAINTANTLANAAAVRIDNSAVLALGFGSTDTVDRIFIGGVEQASGTWGSLASSATNKTPRITGTGILEVTNGAAAPSGYAAWKSTNTTAGTLNQDHDSDGVQNGTEYFMFGSAKSTGFTPLPGVTNNSVTWVKATTGYAGVYNTDFFVETSDTLAAASWAIAPLGVGAGNVEIIGNNVKYTFPTTGPKKFARLKVTGP